MLSWPYENITLMILFMFVAFDREEKEVVIPSFQNLFSKFLQTTPALKILLVAWVSSEESFSVEMTPKLS